jgi:hypothetical protein
MPARPGDLLNPENCDGTLSTHDVIGAPITTVAITLVV